MARSIKEKYERMLLSKANVRGIGIGLHMREGQPTGGVSLIVMVSRKVPASQLAPDDLIPKEIEGVPIDVQEVGDLEAQL
jgi:hypothetical protein